MHPVFSQFRMAPRWTDGVTSRNHVGAVERCAYYQGVTPNSLPYRPDDGPLGPTGALPRVNEELFEWIDVLESVARYARLAPARPYAFAEVGAGYGRWSVTAICALRQLAPAAPFLVLAAEADPDHFAWLRHCLADNAIPPQACRLSQAPVAGAAREVQFIAGDPHDWYGQSIIDPQYEAYLRRHPRAQHLENAYLREPRWWERWTGARAKRRIRPVMAITLATMLADAEVVDMVDMDIQGAEAEVVEGSLQVLRDKVLRLHVGTHSAEVEERIRRALGGGAWRLAQDYPCAGQRETPYGPVGFGDGIQTWINEALEDACA